MNLAQGVDLVVVGDLWIAAMGLSTASFELYLYRRLGKKDEHLWGACLALAATVYALAVAAEYSATSEAMARIASMTLFSMAPVLAVSSAGMAEAMTGRRIPIPSSLRWVGLTLLLALTVSTDLVLTQGFREVNLAAHSQPFIQPQLGPLMPLVLGVALFFGALAVLWLARYLVVPWERWVLMGALGAWWVAGLHDVVVLRIARGYLWLTEYGIVALAAGFLLVHARRYGNLVSSSERIVERAEAGFRLLVERLPLQVLVHREGIILFANEQAARGLGYDSREEIVGHTVYEHMEEGDFSLVRSRPVSMEDIGHSDSFVETRLLRVDGSSYPCEIAGIPILFEGEAAIMAMGQDLTERTRSTARTMQMDRMISVGMLAAGVAHEINNPLTFVINNLEFLQRQILPGANALESVDDSSSPLARAGFAPGLRSEIGAALGDAKDGARRVAHIVRDLKSFTRNQDEQRELDLAEILRVASNLCRDTIARRARLEMASLGGVRVYGNEVRLTQVFVNLLLNAAQCFSSDDPERNRICLRVDVGPTEVSVQVEDNGPGIKSEDEGHIFEPFFSTKDEGMGLGLAICRDTIVGMKGHLWWEGGKDGGSVFHLLLPRLRGGKAPTPEPTPPEEERVEPVSGLAILVIDDEESIGRLMERLLGEDNSVVSVSDALPALELLRAGEAFDVILCDVMMPHMNGVEFCAALVEEFGKGMLNAVVMMSGGAQDSKLLQQARALNTPFLSKPFRYSSVHAAIRESLAR